jgi:hypothetical protein
VRINIFHHANNGCIHLICRLAQRDAARARFEAKRRTDKDARVNERSERAEQIKEKDKKTMEMFKQLAKERFG